MHRKPRITGGNFSWFNRRIEMSNRCCLYCGRLFDPVGESRSNKEHLIGRNFVPEGTLETGFNFTFRACVECNKRKAVAEGHVSAVTLLNSAARTEPEINDLAQRKGEKEFRSRLGAMPVGKALETTKIGGDFFGGSISFTLEGPQQLIPADVREVALSHVQGIFSLLMTSDYLDVNEIRLLPEDQFYLHGFYSERDWGNFHLVELAKRSLDLACYANIVTANGFFKAIFKEMTDGWFWALEWNKQLRIVGGISKKPMSIFSELPDHLWFPIPQGRARKEISIQMNDQLFFGELEEGDDFSRAQADEKQP